MFMRKMEIFDSFSHFLWLKLAKTCFRQGGFNHHAAKTLQHWILQVGLDFASGSGLPVGLDMKTPWARLPVVSCDLHTTMA